MAKSKTNKSVNKKSGSSARRGSSRAKRSAPARSEPPLQPPRPIRREVTGVVFLALAALMIIGWFNTDGAVVDFCTSFVKGLVGWGYYPAGPIFILIGLILLFHRGRPVGFRVFSALILPTLCASLAELMKNPPITGDLELSQAVSAFFASGKELKSGGVLGGLISNGLFMALGEFGTFLLLAVLFLFFLLIAFRGSLSGLFRSSGRRK